MKSINSSSNILETSCMTSKHHIDFSRHTVGAELAPSSFSESVSSCVMQNGNLLINYPGEPADSKKKELKEFCKPSLDCNIRISTVQASELVSFKELEDDALYLKKAADPDSFSFHSVEIDTPYECFRNSLSAQEFEDDLYFKKVADPDVFTLSQPLFGYECMQDTSSAHFSERPILFQGHKGAERVLSDDEMLTGHTSDPGVYHIDIFSAHESPLAHGMFGDVYPVTKIDFATVQEKLTSESSNRNLEQLPNTRKDTLNGSTHVISKVKHGSTQSDCTSHYTSKVLMKASSKFISFSKCNSWWRTLLLIHRNIHKEAPLVITAASSIDQKSDEKFSIPIMGYTSDICDDGGGDVLDFTIRSPVNDTHASAFREQPESSTTEASNGFAGQEYSSNECLSGVQETFNDQVVLWPLKDLISVSTENTTLRRVQDWISNIELTMYPTDEVYEDQSSRSDPQHILGLELQKDEAGANTAHLNFMGTGASTSDNWFLLPAIRSLNAFSTMANISGAGLRGLPPMGAFNSLRILNLSANCIVRITPGSFPRSLHALDLSRNKITVVEGLRDLARLRVLNLSYNRILRIGHGLANCTLIKELYLAGNKISDVEGLHRLTKLTVLDLSFNKLTTSKSLGQLAANYNCLLALNLLGNPVHLNLGEEHLRKLVISLVPRLTYLNKQPIKAVSAREVVVGSVARAALGPSQRASKSGSYIRKARRAGGTESMQRGSRPPSHSAKRSDKRDGKSRGLGDHEHEKARQYHTRYQHMEKGTYNKEHRGVSRISPSKVSPLTAHEHVKERMLMGSRYEGMHRSRSEGTLWGQGK